MLNILLYKISPAEPPAKVQEPEWKDEKSYIIHAEESNYNSILKTKKHALVMFYA